MTPKMSRASAGNRNRCPGQSLLAGSTQESVKHKGVWSHLLERTGISDPAPNEKHFVQVSPQPNSTTTGLAGSLNLLTFGPCIVLELLACVHGFFSNLSSPLRLRGRAHRWVLRHLLFPMEPDDELMDSMKTLAKGTKTETASLPPVWAGGLLGSFSFQTRSRRHWTTTDVQVHSGKL